jgi:hypothetical protein
MQCYSKPELSISAGARKINEMFRIRFRIHYSYETIFRALFAPALLLVILPTTLTVNRARAIASVFPSAPDAVSGVRQYYLSRTLAQANEARFVCAEGYHFASIWEIADPSTLKYNTSLGVSSPDSGDGPPTAISFMGNPLTTRGWVRTGFSYSVSGSPGQANCANWVSNYSFHWGTTANLPSNWTGGGQDIGAWNVGVSTCETNLWVWCVQDNNVWHVFLPLTLRNV